MELYIGTKELTAEPLQLGPYNEKRGWTLPENGDYTREGYFIEYPDGYQSWSPREIFEASYQKMDAMNFGNAIHFLKQGRKLTRKGWNGKGQFIYLVPAAKYAAQTGAAKSHFGEEAFIPYNAYLAIKGVDNTVSTWVPSVTDVLAEDWSIVL